MRRLKYLLWSQILLLAGLGVAQAAETLFESDGALEVELRGPLKKTTRDTRTPDERMFEIATDEGTWPVAVRARGKSRVVYCRFPPLRLNFAAETMTSGPFAGQDKVKLVTHCGEGPRSHDDLLEEYAAYRIFAALSETSHRVRLLRIRYVDTDRAQREPLVRYAFAIEPIEQVAARNGAEGLIAEHLLTSRIDREQAALVFVFEYLLSNADWSLVRNPEDEDCCHNMHVLRRGDSDLLVPYDFDLSGLVEPRYARRAPNLRKRPDRRRSYTGYCLDGIDLDQAIAAVVSRRPEILAIVDGLPWSEADEVGERREFIEAFFAEAAAGGLAERMAEDCVGG